jgi:hypothetical protein
MCNTEPQNEDPAFEISRGAAMAHGCCGGFRTPQAKATVIPFETLRNSCRNDCVMAEDTGEDNQQS